MNVLRAVLNDRRRAQQGSVLSAVLIIVAFLAIIAGALMTELSTNFLLSNALVNRVTTEATINSAVEIAFNQLQRAPINSGCPTLNPVTLNGITAAVGYVTCWPTVDRRSAQFVPIASSNAFNVDGSHNFIPNTSQDIYVVGDSGGNVYAYQFGQSSTIWSRNMQGIITGPPLAMQDAYGWPSSAPDVGGTGGNNADITYLVPIAGGGGSGCTANACVELLGQDVPNTPDVLCHMAATALVTSRPAAGVAFPLLAYFGDAGGTLYAYNATEFSCSNPGPATLMISKTNSTSAAIVAGPVVLPNGPRDEIYVVTSKGSSGQLLRYEYQQNPVSLNLIDTVILPFSNPVGLAQENTGVAPRIAITFAGGGVAIYNTNTSFDPNLAASKAVAPAPGIANAPYWCSCPAGPQIGVAGLNGALYVLDAGLNLVGSYAGVSAIRTTPASDRVGEWFFGADDGYLHEVQLMPAGLLQVAQYGGLGRVGSSVQVAACPAGICIYLGSSNNAYLVPLDARDAVLSACIAASPPTCSGANPRLWAQVEVGAAGSPQTVHVQGWSYYSP